MGDGALLKSAAPIAYARDAFCIRQATERELRMFLERVSKVPGTQILEAHVALIGDEIVAVGGILQHAGDDKLWGFFNTTELPTALGLRVMRALRAGMKRYGEPVYVLPDVAKFGKRAERLLAYLGFGAP